MFALVAQLTDQPGGVPGRARGQPALLEQEHVGPAELAQMIGHRAADDAAADDDDAGGGGKVGHRWTAEVMYNISVRVGDTIMPRALTYSRLRAELKSVLDEVCDTHEPVYVDAPHGRRRRDPGA